MHELCEHLVTQAQKISADRCQQNRELSVSELKAIKRINRISLSLQSQTVQSTHLNQNQGSKLSDLSYVELRNKIRAGDVDANEKLFEYLASRNRQQLSIISPESLKRYVGLLE